MLMESMLEFLGVPVTKVLLFFFFFFFFFFSLPHNLGLQSKISSFSTLDASTVGVGNFLGADH